MRHFCGELLDTRLQRGRELRRRGGLLPQVPQGPVGVHVEGVRGRGGRGHGEGEGRAGQGGVVGHAAVQELRQLEAVQDRLADGEALGVVLQDELRLLVAPGSPVRVSQVVLAALPDEERMR